MQKLGTDKLFSFKYNDEKIENIKTEDFAKAQKNKKNIVLNCYYANDKWKNFIKSLTPKKDKKTPGLAIKDNNKNNYMTITINYEALIPTDDDKYIGERNNNGNRHGKGIIISKNGHKYVGEWNNGKRHGEGTYTYPDGTKYEGNFLDGKRHGQGTYTFPDGKKYEGNFLDGKRHGQGIQYDKDNKKIYEGEWKEDDPDGEGTYTFPDGKKYEGNFLDGKRHGQGIQYDKDNKKIYEGEWKEDDPDGEGTLFDQNHQKIYIGAWKNGKRQKPLLSVHDTVVDSCMLDDNTSIDAFINKYKGENKSEGNFLDGKRHGQGTYTFPDGKKYEGNFLDGKRHGQGIQYDKDNKKIYEGEWKEDDPDGEGTLFDQNHQKIYIGAWKNGKRQKPLLSVHDTVVDSCMLDDNTSIDAFINKYKGENKSEGNFLDGKFHGTGTYTFPDGSKYEGNFLDGKFHGTGTYTFPDGSKYEGNFLDGKFHGKGIKSSKEGNIEYIGEFKEGEIKSGLYFWIDNQEIKSIYEGNFKDGKPHGHGIEYDKDNKKIYEGEWKEGKRDGQGIYTDKDGDSKNMNKPLINSNSQKITNFVTNAQKDSQKKEIEMDIEERKEWAPTILNKSGTVGFCK